MSVEYEFRKGDILSADKLCSLRDYPHDFVVSFFENYGDGVICGMDIVAEEQGFLIKKGILKLDGQVYFIHQEQEVRYAEGENFVYLDIKRKNLDFRIECTVKIFQTDKEENGRFELFRYKKFATVKHYDNMDDLFRYITNRIDRTKLKYSYVGGSSLCGDYFKLYANSILKKSHVSMGDIAFAYQCLNGIRDINIIKQYFGSENMENRNILRLMKEKLDILELRENVSWKT